MFLQLNFNTMPNCDRSLKENNEKLDKWRDDSIDKCNEEKIAKEKSCKDTKNKAAEQCESNKKNALEKCESDKKAALKDCENYAKTCYDGANQIFEECQKESWFWGAECGIALATNLALCSIYGIFCTIPANFKSSFCDIWEGVKGAVCNGWEAVKGEACVIWEEIKNLTCKITYNTGNILGKGINYAIWPFCKIYDFAIEPVVTYFAELNNICFKKWEINTNRITPLPENEWPQSLIDFRGGKRLILCCDGGGVKGILTLQALKKLEEKVGARCIDIFDMFAGTSTGSIIAGSLACGIPVEELIRMYREMYYEIFSKTVRTTLGAVGGGILGGVAGGILGGVAGTILGGVVGVIGVNQLLIPKYNNFPLKCILKSIFKDQKMSESLKDILVTAKDVVRSETVYFSAFHSPADPQDVRGTYKDIKMREAILASAGSAPIYFEPVGRFIDGGVGGYNNTNYVAPVEAIRYSAKIQSNIMKLFDDSGNMSTAGNWPEFDLGNDYLYSPDEIVVLSFGTGRQPNNMKKGEADKKIIAIDWVQWLIGEGMDDADDQQSYISRIELDDSLQFINLRRYQIYFSEETISELKKVDNNSPHSIDYSNLGMDSVGNFDFFDNIGVSFGIWINSVNGFEPTWKNPRPTNADQRKQLQIFEVGNPLFVRRAEFNLHDSVNENPAREGYISKVKKELNKVYP